MLQKNSVFWWWFCIRFYLYPWFVVCFSLPEDLIKPYTLLFLISKKTRLLLKHLTQNKIAFSYYPIDISSSAIDDLINTLKRDFKNLESNEIVAYYSCDLTYLRNMKKGTNLVLFLGSNIRNMNFSQSIIFLRRIRRSLNIGD